MVIHKKCGKNEKCKIINFALSSRSKKVRLSQGQNLGLYFWDFKKPQRSKSAVLPFFKKTLGLLTAFFNRKILGFAVYFMSFL